MLPEATVKLMTEMAFVATALAVLAAMACCVLAAIAMFHWREIRELRRWRHDVATPKLTAAAGLEALAQQVLVALATRTPPPPPGS